MFMFMSVNDGVGGNGARAYQCATCAGLVTYSDRLLSIDGTNRHLFVNPAGMECDFHTFYSCPGAVALGEAFEAHSWFSGYSWRMAFCHRCGQHLGWYYEAALRSRGPWEFWGILISHLLRE